MPDREESAIQELLHLPPFRHSDAAVHLIKELNKDRAGVSWDKLASRVFKKPMRQVKASAFRSLLYRVRQWLDEAYEDPTSPLQQYPRLQIVIDGRLYKLEFKDAGTRPYLNAFWRPYLASEVRQIQTADRFFLRLGDHFYFRDIRSPGRPDWTDFLEPLCDVLNVSSGPFSASAVKKLEHNVRSAFAAQIAAFLSDPINWEQGAMAKEVTAEEVAAALLAKFSPDVSRHYVSAGESVGLTHIAELFQSFQKPVIFGNRVGIAPDNETADIVQIGKTREGSALAELLENERFRLGNDRIVDTKHMAGPPLEDNLRTHADDISAGNGSARVKYALVTRCPHRKEGHVITNIVASHGRVTEAACLYLASEASMAETFKQLKWGIGSIPTFFQFVLKAEVSYGGGSDRTTAKIVGVEPGWQNPPQTAI